MLQYGGWCAWKEDLSTFSRVSPIAYPKVFGNLGQLSCRILLQICPPVHSIAVYDIFNARESIARDTLAACVQLITSLHDQADRNEFVGSLIGVYDIFSAGAHYACKALRLEENARSSLPQFTAVVNQCSTLLTIASSNFGIAKIFRKILQALSTMAIQGNKLEAIVSRFSKQGMSLFHTQN
jgi:hypothetical protein